jgi:hypothetical protein
MLCIQSLGGHLSTPSIGRKSVGPSLAKLSEGASEVIDWTGATKTASPKRVQAAGFFRSVLIVVSDIALASRRPDTSRAPSVARMVSTAVLSR